MPKSFPKQSIPLLCNLCPKRPDFSDVSHLLTHISSKGHLSHRFNLQIRAQGEPDARRQLERFDTWYAENCIEDLLSDRMAAKEYKKTSKKLNRSVAAKKDKGKSAEPAYEQPLASSTLYRLDLPRMHIWSTGTNGDNSGASDLVEEPPECSAYATPTMKRDIPNFLPHRSPRYGKVKSLRQSPQKSEETEDENETVIRNEAHSSKLKGIYWPGMDLFDSATAEMKRIRNQRKDGAVLAQMKITSTIVEPMEWIFDADGAFRKVRDIYSPTMDSSPVKTDDDYSPKMQIPRKPSPRRRKQRRAPLLELSANIPRLEPSFTSAVPRREPVKRNKKIKAFVRSVQIEPSERKTLGGVTYDHHISNDFEDDDFEFQRSGATKKSKFGIYRDADDSPGNFSQAYREIAINPDIGHRESLPADRCFDLHHGLILEVQDTNAIGYPSPTTTYKHIPVQFAGKENAIADYYPHSSLVPATGFPPQVFHDHSFNPLLYHSNGPMIAYNEGPEFLEDIKSGSSTFNGDFKPLMMPNFVPDASRNHTSIEKFNRSEDMNFNL